MKKILMTIALLCTVAQWTWAQVVSYINYSVNDDGKTLTKNNFALQNPYTVLTSELLENSNEDNLDSGWYVLNSSFTYAERIVISGDVHLILCDGCTLTAKQGIRINTDAKLSIYAQSETSGTMGKLVAIETHHDKAAIGGNKNWEAGRLFIHGGEIEAKCNSGSKYAAGIGGGYGDGSGMKGITIYGGKVTAQGAQYGAGIGGGKNNNHPGTIRIYGGDITADGGDGGAGIGGGVNRGDWLINIYGGTIKATGHGTEPYDDGAGGAGIGGGTWGYQKGSINIEGGDVWAEGHYAAGIGGGYGGKGGEVLIRGGVVTAYGGWHAAGIGGGGDRDGGYIYIFDGNVTAETVWGTACCGAAIGGGYGSSVEHVDISGGKVTTKVHKHNSREKVACNIGTGADEEGGFISLGKNMCVKPQSGLAITSKRYEACREQHSVAGGEGGWWTVEVYKCEHADMTYSYINESGHTAHCKYCEYTKSEEHSMVAANNTCEKCGYGNGTTISTLSFYMTTTESTSDYMASGTLYVQGQNIALPSCTNVPDGMMFVGWLKQDTAPSSIEAADEETSLLQPGDQYTVDGNETLYARYRYDFTETWMWDAALSNASLTIKAGSGDAISVTPVTVSGRMETAASDAADGSITATATATYTHGKTTYTFSSTQTKTLSYNLSLDEDDNTDALNTYDGRSMNVTLTGRTLYKDGNWNTLCLPFDVALEDSPLAGATVKELTDASFANGTLTLAFADATFIEAGRAYLIKWDSGNNLEPSDLVFTGVTLVNDLNDDAISTDDSGTATVTFMGTYKKLSFDADDRTVLYVGADNQLYYPQSGVSIGAQRAYFKLNGLTVGNIANSAIVLDFGDGETTTGISPSPTLPQGEEAWYSLDGRRLNGKPTAPGLYIHNGKKVIIK